MGFFHFMQGFLSSGTLGFHCTKNIKNYSILFYQCEDIDKSFEALGRIEDNNRWQAHIASWFANSPKFDGSEKAQPLKKIFDLNEQLNGFLGE